MKWSERDIDVTTDTTTALLRHFDWNPTGKVPGRYEVWTTAGRQAEVLVPLDPERGDYDALLRRAIWTLTNQYGDEAGRLLDLLSLKVRSALDSTRWQKQTSVNAGLIPWADGEALYRAAQSSLIASAKATRRKRMHHGPSSAYVAKQFLAETLMGQTEVGSFIITAHTPAGQQFFVDKKSEREAASDWRKGERISGRSIIDTLENSLMAVRSGLDEYRSSPRVDGFLPLVEDGVSHELVKALAVLTTGGDAAVFIEHAGAEGEAKRRPVEVAFDASEAQVLEKVAERFAEAEPPRAVRITGEVIGLDNSTSSPVYLVRLDVKTGADVRHARVRLSPEQYLLAVDAHRSQMWLAVSGQLEKDGRDFWLYGAEDVRPIEPPPGAVTTPTFIVAIEEIERRALEGPEDDAS